MINHQEETAMLKRVVIRNTLTGDVSHIPFSARPCDIEDWVDKNE
jgi:hypothetical protein